MHGLLLKNMPIPIFNRLVNRFYNEFRFRSVDYLVDTNYIEKSLQILNLVFEGGEDGDKTYYRHLKRFDIYDLYRTYSLDKMTGIKKVTYDFSKFDIQRKLIELEMKKLPKELTTEEVEEQEEKIKKITEKFKREQNIKFELQLRESNLDTGVKG